MRALAVASGDIADAEEAVQDAFVQAHRHWARVRTYQDPAGWVRRAAINRLANRRRSFGRRTKAMTRLAALPAPRTTSGLERLDVASALSALPERQRLAVCLFYLADLPIAEIAPAMDVTEGTVKSSLHDARRKLRQTLEDHGDG